MTGEQRKAKADALFKRLLPYMEDANGSVVMLTMARCLSLTLGVHLLVDPKCNEPDSGEVKLKELLDEYIRVSRSDGRSRGRRGGAAAARRDVRGE